MTKVDVTLAGVNISLLSGSGKIKGLVIGNPEGYKTSNSISVGTAALALQPGSLLSDKIVIKSINVEAPEITFEGGLSGNNLSKILANLNESSTGPGSTNISGATPKEEKKAAKKLQVDDFLITGAKVHFNGTTLPLPDIHLTGLGQGPDGITPAALIKEVLGQVNVATIKAVAGSAGDAGKAIGGEASKLGKSLGGLFKKK